MELINISGSTAQAAAAEERGVDYRLISILTPPNETLKK